MSIIYNSGQNIVRCQVCGHVLQGGREEMDGICTACGEKIKAIEAKIDEEK